VSGGEFIQSGMGKTRISPEEGLKRSSTGYREEMIPGIHPKAAS